MPLSLGRLFRLGTRDVFAHDCVAHHSLNEAGDISGEYLSSACPKGRLCAIFCMHMAQGADADRARYAPRRGSNLRY